MPADVKSAQALPGLKLRLEFEDGATGTVDLKALVKFDGVFEPLLDQDFFDKVSVDPDLGTVTWPNGADLDPDVLHSLVLGSRST